MKKLLKVLLVVFVVSALALTLIACNQNPCKKNGHKWDSGTETTPATCTEDGVMTYKCTNKGCTETRTEVITKLDHLVTTWTASQTDETKHEGICTRSGCGATVTESHRANQAGTECLDCHKTLGGGGEDVCLHPDKTLVSTDPATCTTAAVQHWSCDCGWTNDVPVGQALGHQWGNWGNDTATCTEGGIETRTCERPGCNSNEGQPAVDSHPTIALGHDEVKTSADTPATCIAAAVEHWGCSRCNWTENRDAGQALGHQWGPWGNNTATCTAGGTETRTCERPGCNSNEGQPAVDSRPTDALEHNYDGATWTPSTSQLGKHERSCTYGCGTKDYGDCDSLGTLTGAAATCTTAGRADGTKCSVCGGNQTLGAVINALGHNVTTWTECEDDDTKHEGICTREDCGVTVVKSHRASQDGTVCLDCGKVLSEQPCEHPNKEHTDDAATCTTAKVEHWTCPDCSWTDDVTVGEPLGHQWGEWGNNTATCTSIGIETRTCERPGCNSNDGNAEEETRPTTALGHNEIKVSEDTPATCTAAAVEHWGCSRCDWTQDRNVGEALGHQWGNWGNDTATCTEGGIETRTCERPGCNSNDGHAEEETRPTTALGHNEVKVSADTPATCTAAAVEHWGCTRCDWTQDRNVGEPNGHSYPTTWSVSDTEGKHQHACTVCGTIEYENCDDDGVLTGTAATCTTAGREDGTKCSVCGGNQKQGAEIAALDHDKYLVSTDEATCTTAKVEHWACNRCSWTENKTVSPALGHDYTGVEWAPSTITAGKHYRTCTRCDYIERKDCDNAGTIAGVAATCTTAGKEAGTKCSVCSGNVKEGAVIAALGHDWSKTYSANDTEHWKKCLRCDAKTQQGPHNFGTYGHDLLCSVCEKPRPGENYVLTYTINGEQVQQSYRRLADAIAFIAEYESVNNVVIEVGDLEDNVLEGLGVEVPAKNLTITIDLNGCTYIVASEPVTAGGKVLGFQILAGNNITIKNGTITSAEDAGVTTLIENYANLTLEGVTLDGRNLDASGATAYTMSNYGGDVYVRVNSKIYAHEDNGVALSVLYNGDKVDVTIGQTTTVSGAIEYGSAESGADLKTQALLSLPTGTYDQLRYTTNVPDCVSTGITINGQALTAHWSVWETTKEPTCTEEGEKERHCTLCGKLDTGSIATVAHDVPTATYIGGQQHEGACTMCGETVTVACTEVDNSCTVCGRQLYVTENANVTIDTRQQGYTDQKEVTEIKSGKITVAFDPGTNTNTPKYYDTGAAVRLYGGGTMTVSIADGLKISKITLTFGEKDGSNAITADSGNFSNNVWTGSEESVVFSVASGSGHRRIQTITIEYTVKACNHFYTEWEESKPATCTEDGEMKRVCLDCEAVDTEEISAHHTLAFEEAKAPSCLETGTNGNVAYYHCDACGKNFQDAAATTEIANTVVTWSHTFETIPEVAATADANGKQSYYHCTVCDRNYELDGTTLITDLANWGVIAYDCEHATHEWKNISGQHVYVCSVCGKDEQYAHAPTNGAWSAAEVEGTEVHSLSCGYEDAACPFTVATHDADYADVYTVCADGEHAKACKADDCTLVDDKHAAEWGAYQPTSDDKQHYQECEYCGDIQTDAEPHSIEDYTYAGNGKHEGICACGVTEKKDCNSNGDDNSCTVCGRIVGTKNSGGNDALIAPATSTSTSGNNVTYISGKVTFVLTENNSSKGGFGQSELRFYANNKLTITVDGGLITKVELYAANSNKPTATNPTSNVGTQSFVSDIQTTTFDGDGVNSVTFTAGAQVRFTKVIVYYSASSVCYHDNTLVECKQGAATCESVGYTKDCWHCENCDMYFTTQDCTALAKNVVISATGHNYGDLIEQRSATCELEAYLMDHYYCEVCGKYFNSDKEAVEQSAVVGTTATHTWGDWSDNNDGTHTRTCSFGVHTETDDCTFDENVWVNDAGGHWHECALCGYIFDEGFDGHDTDGADGACSVCGYAADAINVTISVNGGVDSLVAVSIKQVKIGEQVNFTVDLKNDGYRVVSVLDFLTETEIEASSGVYTYTFTEDSVSDGEVLLNITIIKQVTVTLSDVANGSIAVTYGTNTLTSGDKVDVGTKLTITVTPSDGYKVNSVSVNGTAISDNTYTIPENATAITISAVTEVQPNLTVHTLTLNFTTSGHSAASLTTTSTSFTDSGITYSVNNVQGYSNYLMLKSSSSYLANSDAIPGAITKVEVYTTSGASTSATYYVEITSSPTLAENTASTATKFTGKTTDTTPITATADVEDNKCYFNITQKSAKNGQIAKVVITYYA